MLVIAEVDPGYFLEWGVPLRNDAEYKEGGEPLYPFGRSTPAEGMAAIWTSLDNIFSPFHFFFFFFMTVIIYLRYNCMIVSLFIIFIL